MAELSPEANLSHYRIVSKIGAGGIYEGLGEKDQAFKWLEKDFQSHNATMPNFLYLLSPTPLVKDPRFKDLARRIGLPELK